MSEEASGGYAGKFSGAAAKRQTILDFVNANPRSTARQVADHIGVHRDSAAKTLKGMTARGEIKRVDVGGRVVFIALETKTKGWTPRGVAPQQVNKWVNGRFVRRSANDPCLKNSGGQGAAPPRAESSIGGVFW